MPFFVLTNCNPSISFDTHDEIKPLKDLRVYSWCSGKDIFNSRIIDTSENTVKRNIIFLPNILCKNCTTDSPFVYPNKILIVILLRGTCTCMNYIQVYS